MTASFTWVPLYEELADRLAEWESRQQDLVALLNEMREQGFVVTPTMDRDIDGATDILDEIDPFTFFGSFNRGICDQHRLDIIKTLRDRLGAKSDIPSDFTGIPTLNNQRSWFFTYKSERSPMDVPSLWRVFRIGIAESPLNRDDFDEAFNAALQVKCTNLNLTMGLFWIRPGTFVSLDATNREYLGIKLPTGGITAAYYRDVIQKAQIRGVPFVELSHVAYLDKQQKNSLYEEEGKNKKGEQQQGGGDQVNYWLGGAHWNDKDPPDQTDEFVARGIWMNAYRDRYLDEVRHMKVGDRIAIKSTYNQKNNLPFDARGKTVPCMAIKAIGTVVANRDDGRTVEVEWDPNFEPKTWYFTAHWRTIERISIDEVGKRLIAFAFRGESQDYEWFLKEYVLDAGGGPSGPDSDAFGKAYSVEDVIASGAFLTTEQITQTLERLESKKNLILQGPPGVGKTFLARKLAYALIGEKSDQRVRFVQFHQSYSYEDFVRGYRPMPEKAGCFGLQDGVFFEFCRKAAKDPDRKYVFIIDEINRGNLSQIFGELLMLVEGDKRGDQYSVPLVYRHDGEPDFFVPSNLYLMGLMNLADRSLALVDYALRRRFTFLSLTPRFADPLFCKWLSDRGMAKEIIELIVSRMTWLNSQIADDPLLGPNYEVGHSFFCPKGEDFSKLGRGWYERVVETELLPLLKEYWFDNPQRAAEMGNQLLKP